MIPLREAVGAIALILSVSAARASGPGWIDLLTGDPVSDAGLLSELRNARILYLGEAHTVPSHHRVEERLLRSLASETPPLTLFLEALESRDAPALSRFAAGELSFEELARTIDWPRRWSNFRDYRGLCLLARERHVRILGMDGPSLLFHRIARQGWASVSPDERKQMSLTGVRFDPLYQRLLQLFLPIHPGKGRSWQVRAAEAQEVRDDWMAEHIVRSLRKTGVNQARALVICGAGHLRFGLGLPEHVASRLPLPRRILLLAAPAERRTASGADSAGKTTGAPSIPHASFEFVARPLADYLWLPPDSFPVKDEPDHAGECPLGRRQNYSQRMPLREISPEPSRQKPRIYGRLTPDASSATRIRASRLSIGPAS
ncbi:protein of unknown function [Methylacidimicrobium sp. AP8]|uniref:ChaN family lipoprotein n=1 Tax=Methylacidimicrobium sp. AP8 TaxID=2730359 RepID=UPI0018BFCDEC|nr:ChaN family lipoprotein [Methylacidimicrobium sp. AP8]CAB4244632.1 protein of unknown function [Methylacidimicrobium sp. AP8]